MDAAISGDFWEARPSFDSIGPTMPPVPDHKPSGVLPPFLGDSPDETSALMSPYRVSLKDVIERFATSEERKRILSGYLEHRAALRRIGVNRGFQWLVGSFVDRTPREPNDLDLVTFFYAPPEWDTIGAYQAGLDSNKELFDPGIAKATFKCDAQFVRLDDDDATGMVQLVSYWLGLFSHQKGTHTWRGIVSVHLSAIDEDGPARAALSLAPFKREAI